MDDARQACFVSYQYGAAQALALAARFSTIPFNPRSLDLPSIGALVGFYHACLGFPVKQTWLEAIKTNNCDSFDGLTYANATKYCPDLDETIMGHLAQQCQNVRSTKPKPSAPNQAPLTPAIAPQPSTLPSNEVYIHVYPINKLYTDYTGQFPIKACSGNQYDMIAYHANGNLILQQAFKSRSNTHSPGAYNAIMMHLVARGLSVDLQILDNKASAADKHAITFTWQAKFQLVPPDMHCRNCAEQAIRTFKALFLSILAGVDPTFPPYLWDLLLPQAELTLNLLRQSALSPQISVWEFFQGPFDFNKTLLGPVGCRIVIHAKPATGRSWDFCAKEGYYIGLALDLYCCFKLVKSDTKSQVISDTVEFRHTYRTVPSPSPEDKIIHGLHVMSGALKDAPPPTSISQMEAIANLRDLVESWHSLGPFPTTHGPVLSPGRPRVAIELPRVATPLSPTVAATPAPAWMPPPRPACYSSSHRPLSHMLSTLLRIESPLMMSHLQG